MPIGVSYEKAKEELDQFFALDFQNGRDCTLRYFDDGIKAIEVIRTSPLLLVIHIVLTFISLGLWLVVWFLIDANRYLQRERVRFELLPASLEGTSTARVSGSDSWVQTTEAFIRRNLRSA